MTTIYGTNGNDDIFGSEFADDIFAGGGDDWITGSGGADFMYGQGGDDVFYWEVLDSSASAFGLISGGAGYDLVDMSNFSSSTVFYNDSDQVVRAGARNYDFEGVEEIWLSSANDTLTDALGITAESSPLALFLGGGDDYAALAGAITINGEAGNDTFKLTGVINSSITIHSTVFGGEGFDKIVVGQGFTVDLYEGTAVSGDSVYYIESIEDVAGVAAADASQSTVVYGNDLGNRLTVAVDNATTSTIGVDYFGYGGNDYLSGSRGQDLLEGGAGADKLFGMGGGDTLRGGDSADRIDGGAGSDYLEGGKARDVLTGGTGADDFTYLALGDSGKTASSADLITDFHHGDFDLIDLSAIDAIAGTATNDAFAFIGTNGFTGHKGELRYAFSGGDTYVQADVNGDGVADMMIHLSGQVNLVADDFVL